MSSKQFLADAREIVGRPLDQIGRGMTFIASWKNDDGSPVSDNAIFGLVLYNTSLRTHLTFQMGAGSDVELLFYELTSLGATGTPLTAYNMKRGSGIASTVNVWHTPTSPTGTPLFNYYQELGLSLEMGGLRADTEWELSTGTAYFIGGINRAGSNQPASVVAQWWEDNG